MDLRVIVDGSMAQYGKKKWIRMVMARMAMVGSYSTTPQIAKSGFLWGIFFFETRNW